MSSTLLVLAFTAATQTFNLPQGLLPAICYVESTHDTRAFNPNDGGTSSLGVCQLKLATAQLVGYRGSALRLQSDPSVNTYYAAKYIRYQLDRYNGDVFMAVAAYNSGTYNVNSSGQPRNVKYVNKVYAAWTEGR